MRILHVASHTELYRGGAVQLSRMALRQAERGHAVQVIVRAEGDAGAEESWGVLTEAGIRVEALPYESFRGWLRLCSAIRREPWDILHAHRDPALKAAWTATLGLKRPALVAQRGTTLRSRRTVRLYLRSSHVRAVVAVAAEVRRAVASWSGCDASKIHVVYGSVDLEEFKPRPAEAGLREEMELPADARVIGSLSSYHRKKGLEHLMHALPEVFERHPEAYMVFLGGKVEEKLKPLAAQLNVADRCRFVGYRTDTAGWLSIMDLTAVAATHGEGLSGVLRESLAMEVPVVSTDCAGNGEIVQDGKTGLLVPTKDHAALRDALIRALDRPDEMKAMARAGRQWVEENCGLDSQAAALEAVYESVVR